tara:strand:+ start:212 stop:511 length:300 start_codon:yes stop_codon:yes gene_type:complete
VITKQTGGGVMINFAQRSSEPKKRKSKPRREFVGNVLLDNIIGVKKKKDITYGKKKVAKEEKKLLKISRSAKNRMSISTKSSQGILGLGGKKKSKVSLI